MFKVALMSNDPRLQFSCQECDGSIHFSLFELNRNNKTLTCPHCQISYDFGDENLQRQLHLFANLCQQIHLSAEILSCTSVGVNVGDREVKIPYKLLLTRLNPTINLTMDGRSLTIAFRMEPTLAPIH